MILGCLRLNEASDCKKNFLSKIILKEDLENIGKSLTFPKHSTFDNIMDHEKSNRYSNICGV